MTTGSYWCDLAWLGGPTASESVLIEVTGSVITAVTPGVAPPAGAEHLRGLALPGMANTHSHAFHRALRGGTHGGSGDFWTWRDQMYRLAGCLDPDSYHALAVATYAEMAVAGIAAVGEFHYLHRDRSGAPYGEANIMGEVLIDAASQAGIRITLLDTCYLRGGFDQPLGETQRRFSDGTAEAWAARVEGLRDRPGALVGAAIHSVRAVPAGDMSVVAGWASERGAPLHVHLSEQRAENDDCRAHTGRTPTELLADVGALGSGTTAIHATHLEDGDISLLGRSGTGVCVCPTTERDLGDGITPARALAGAGSTLSAGSDSHAVIDLFEEARAIELDQRLAEERRGLHRPEALLDAITGSGMRALGWPSAGRLEVGANADITVIGLDNPQLAGADRATAVAAAVFAASARLVTDVIVDGRRVVSGGRHCSVDVPATMRAALTSLL